MLCGPHSFVPFPCVTLSVQEQYDATRANYKQCKTELTVANTQIRALTAQVADLKNISADHVQVVNEARDGRLRAEDSVRAANDTVHRLKAELSQVKVDLRVSEQGRVAFEAEVEKRFKKESELLVQQLHDQSATISGLKCAIQAEKAAADRCRSDLEGKIVGLSHEVLECKRKLAEKEGQLSELRAVSVGPVAVDRSAQFSEDFSLAQRRAQEITVDVGVGCVTIDGTSPQGASHSSYAHRRFSLRRPSAVPEDTRRPSVTHPSNIVEASVAESAADSDVMKLQIMERDRLLSKMTSLMRHYRELYEGLKAGRVVPDHTPSMMVPCALLFVETTLMVTCSLAPSGV
jgi:predicted  nucleic acid-binding Zn-ribbon protein